MMIRLSAALALTMLPAGCAMLDRAPQAPGDDLAREFAAPVTTTPLGASAYAPQSLDRTSAEEKAAARAQAATAGERQLGRVVVALAPPAQTGLWVETALVTSPARGRVTTGDGRSLAVELRPATGAALMSFSAYQALGLPLTALPEITVFAL